MNENEIKENSIQVLVSNSTKEAIDRIAEEEHRSTSNWCRIVLEEKLNEIREHDEE